MAGEESDDQQAKAVLRAAILVTEAMDLIDAYGGPADAAAHLDLALASLRDSIGNGNARRAAD